ncbi:lipoyl(octanoyl) transferase LipB [Gammaproteobacteria bacterium]|nr:lipoyl(octanoyl) transferase LipB [Gammaproteobacteria bacterium]MDA8808556.1 lipoyl(octanoyl) transferase LipB [Gammaproteobacteria bacterium]MDA8857267.1 lipoyl(octanoyl) transferase LipB [Gammaproteobacteria bacterium]MDA9000876.1 lipoyl(octanoyl) transferase LipB [Gammaproteobacteria bacterium]MDA9252212.1 lipoyl(octanoyl) transferase LipB [Gammaproteobacteria bacterium]
MSKELIFKSLGVSNYLETLVSMKAQLQAEYFQNEIWLLEHPPVFTLGTAADNQHILDAKDIPIIQSDRGGEVTYHGPGQLVIYFMIDIKRNELGPKSLVKTLQEFTKSLLANYSIESNFIEGAPGVYVDGKKIASIGLRISKGKTYHGISINVDMDLTPFSYINPCGYTGLEVTQIKDFKKDIKIKDVERLAIKLLEPIF